MTLALRLAAVACNRWFEVAELPTRWRSASPEQRATFMDMAAQSLRCARAGRRDEPAVARALCHGFWLRHERPRLWLGLGPMQQQVFILVARAVIAEGQAAKAEAGQIAA